MRRRRRKLLNLLGGLELPNRMHRMLCDPDPTGLGGGGATTTPVEPVADVPPTTNDPNQRASEPADLNTQVATNTTQADPFASPARQPADPNQRAGVTQPAAQVGAQDWQSIRDAATALGYQFGQDVTDDRTALAHLIRQASGNRQQDFYAQLGRQLAPQAQGIQNYLQTQRAPAAPERQPWEAPEFDERWAGLVDRDPQTGIFVGKPGTPPQIVDKVNAYVEWKQNFDRNPAGVINGMVESRAKEIAKATFQEQFQAQAREQVIGQIVQENSPWLYATDQATGQVIVNPVTNQYTPTPVGARYLHHLAAAQRMGVVDPRQQDALAKNLVRGEFAMAAQQAAATATGQAANPQTQQAIAQPNRNVLQSQAPLQRQTNPAATEPSGSGLSLNEQLRQALAAEGVTDADFANMT